MTSFLTAILIATSACHPPAGATVKQQTIPITAYYLPSETDGWTGSPVRGLPGRSTQYDFWKAVQMNGTGRTARGEWVVVDGAGFREIAAPRGRYGPLAAFRTAAANPSLFPADTTVCLPSLGGLTVTVTDTGGGLGPAGPLDIFVGDKAALDEWLVSGPEQALVFSWGPDFSGPPN